MKGTGEKVNKKRQAKQDLQADIGSFFVERDKTKRGNEGLQEDTGALALAEAEIKQSLYEDSLKEVAIDPKIQPMFNTMFVTAKRNKVMTDGGIMLVQNVVDDMELDYTEQQKVMSVGPQVQQTEVGDTVVIDYRNYRHHKSETMAQKVNKETSLNVPTITIEGREYIMVSERDLKYIIKS